MRELQQLLAKLFPDPPDPHTGGIPPCVVERFRQLGQGQRAEPESAMVQAQRVLGGGVLSFALEHTGDLTHRMTQFHDSPVGYINVREKVIKVLRVLKQAYGFGREHLENMISNAHYDKIPYDMYRAAVVEALNRYVEAHSKLVVYNEAQYVAQHAAMALGREQFQLATQFLMRLYHHLQTPARWTAYAWQYVLGPDDCPLPYGSPEWQFARSEK